MGINVYGSRGGEVDMEEEEEGIRKFVYMETVKDLII